MSKRVPKVNQLLKKELSQILLKEIEFSPNILVTVTRVETTNNLFEAKVWISVLPEEKRVEVLEQLNEVIYTLQQIVNKRLKMRPVPKIKFLEEKKTGEADTIEKILEGLKKERLEKKEKMK